MSVRINYNTWRELLDAQVYNLGAPVSSDSLSIRTSNTWEKSWPDPIPDNMILLYQTNAQFSGLNTSALFTGAERFPIGATAGLNTPVGVNTHNGSDHGTKTDSLQSTNNIAINYGPYNGADTNNAHSHNNLSHNHTDVSAPSIVPEYFNLIPRLGGDYIGAGSVFMSYDTLNWGDWTLITSYVNRYLRLIDSQTSVGTGGFATHGHVNKIAQTSTYTIDEASRYSVTGSTYYSSHYHKTTYSMVNANNSPSSVLTQFHSIDADLFDWTNLPSGTIAFFTTSSIPSGWNYFSTHLDRIPKSVSSGSGTSGASTHSHTCNAGIMSIYNSGGFAPLATIPDTFYMPGAVHSHVLSGVTPHTSANSLPYRLPLYPAKKD